LIVSGQVEEIITLITKDCNIEGTLLVPDNTNETPLAIIIAGSGPTDRNGNNSMMTNNSLKMLAEGLVENGIATLRYDKRGVGKSANIVIAEQDLRFNHYIDDVNSWIKLLNNDERFNEIIIIGHSEGALIGAVASQNGSVIKFVSIAGTGQSIDKILKEQLKAQPPIVLEQSIPILDSLSQGHLVNNVPTYLNSLFRKSVQPYMISWMKFDPCVEISKLNIPVLVVQGATDIQVSTNDARLLSEANQKAGLVLIEGMNHIFKNVEIERNANIATYSNPDLPINELFLNEIVSFIKD
jgi:hypothetical protein